MNRRLLEFAVMVSTGLQISAIAGPSVLEGRGQALSVQHEAHTCWQAEEFPLIDLTIAGTSAVADAQLYFKKSGEPDWYYVDMEPTAANTFTATLPRPESSAGQVQYYALIVAEDLETAQTPEVSVDVRNACSRRRYAAAPPSSLVVKGTVEGQPAIPAGFGGAGITSFVTAGGEAIPAAAIAGGASAGAAAATGISAATLGIIGGAGAAAAVGVAVSQRGGDSATSSTSASSSTSGGSMPTSACVARADQLELRIPMTAFDGSNNSCSTRTRQQIYELVNRSACTVQLENMAVTFAFSCMPGVSGGGPLGNAQLLAMSVPPNSTTVIRMGAPAGSRGNLFCCPDATPCVSVCTQTDTITLSTNGGMVSASYTFAVDSTIDPDACPLCSTNTPNVDYW